MQRRGRIGREVADVVGLRCGPLLPLLLRDLLLFLSLLLMFKLDPQLDGGLLLRVAPVEQLFERPVLLRL